MLLRILTVLIVCALPLLAHAEDAKKWNVLFLMADDLRPELGCYGHPQVKTPHIDGLAKSGVRFDRAYCQFPLCNPSRTSLLTGRLPTTTGVLDNLTWFGGLHPDLVSLPKHFQANGYVTLRSGKIFHGGIDDSDAWTEGGEKRTFEGAKSNRKPNPNQKQQSDRIVVLDGDGEGHADHRAAGRAIEFLRKYKDRPFFLACGFTKPHSAPTAPKQFFDLYDPRSVTLPKDFATRPTVPAGFPKLSVPVRNGDLFIDRDASPDAAREMIRAYWASLTFTDWNVGRVLAELDQLGLRDRTIILFWGDHGYHLGEKGKWSKHQSLFEVGTRVPLLVALPGATGNGKASPRTVQALDFYPTLIDLCKLPPVKGLEGHSLRPLLDNPAAEWNHPAFTVTPTGRAVRTERWRYAEWEGGQSGAMLFDHHGDPHEMMNLAGDARYAEVQKELAAVVRKLK